MSAGGEVRQKKQVLDTCDDNQKGETIRKLHTDNFCSFMWRIMKLLWQQLFRVIEGNMRFQVIESYAKVCQDQGKPQSV